MATYNIPGVGKVNVGNNTASAKAAGGTPVSSGSSNSSGSRSSGGGGGSSSNSTSQWWKDNFGYVPDHINGNTSLTPKPSSGNIYTTPPSTGTWQDRLRYYGTTGGRDAANAEIARAQEVWKQKTAAGDTVGATAAHRWANQIRDALGMQAGINYNPLTGATLTPLNNIQQPRSLTPQQQEIIPNAIPSIFPELPPMPQLQVPEYKPYEPKPFQNPNRISITSDGNDVYSPTISGLNAWNNQQNQMAQQYLDNYKQNYSSAIDIYNSNMDAYNSLINQLGFKKEMERKSEDMAYKQAWDRWIATGQLTPEDAAILGIPVGTENPDYVKIQADIEAAKALATQRLTPRSSGGGGGGSNRTESGLTPYQQEQMTQSVDKAARDYAKTMVEIDSRINNPGSYIGADGQEYGVANTPEQIFDAYYRQYLTNYYGQQ